MEFFVTKTSDWDYKEHIEINTLEELLKFVKENGDIIIQNPYPYRENLYSIEITDALPISDCDDYDDYRE